MRWYIGLLLIFGVVVSGCSVNKGTLHTNAPEKLSGENTEIRSGKPGDQIVGNYRVYDKEFFNKALADKNITLLYFYANWCPECKNQERSVEEVFKYLASNGKITGFRVNVMDSETTPDGEAIMKEYGITIAPSFIVLGEDGKVRRDLNGEWKEEDMKQFLEKGAPSETTPAPKSEI